MNSLTRISSPVSIVQFGIRPPWITVTTLAAVEAEEQQQVGCSSRWVVLAGG